MGADEVHSDMDSHTQTITGVSSTGRPARRVAVFCGASNGARPEYAQAARALGNAIARRGGTLIYGGGRAGLMGAVADGALEGGGRVVGVITRLLVDRELGHTGIQELKVVET